MYNDDQTKEKIRYVISHLPNILVWDKASLHGNTLVFTDCECIATHDVFNIMCEDIIKRVYIHFNGKNICERSDTHNYIIIVVEYDTNIEADGISKTPKVKTSSNFYGIVSDNKNYNVGTSNSKWRTNVKMNIVKNMKDIKL